MSREMQCPICGASGPFPDAPSPAGWRLLDCRSCGTAFLSALPAPAELGAYYDESYYGKGRKKFAGALETAILKLTALKWRAVRGRMRPGARMVDVGCGRGTLVRLARQEGFDAHGVERSFPHPDNPPFIHHQDLADCQFPAGHFQMVTIWHVLEHVYDPVGTLREINRILEPGGWLSLAVPNYGGLQAQASGAHWFHLDLPRHFWHFRPEGLTRIVRQMGFEVAKTETLSVDYDWYGTIQSWMNRVAGDENRLYEILKGRRRSAADTLLRLSAATAIALPALVSALSDAARGRGGTLTLTLRKPS